LMFAVEIGIPQQVLTIDDAVKVGHASLGDEGVVLVDMRPQGGNDEVIGSWIMGLLVAFSPIFRAIIANKIPIIWYCHECHSHCTFAAN
jgi:hypothetical protein